MRVLIADDHQLVIDGVKLKLSEFDPGIEFVIATNVDQMEQVLRRSPPPDMALIDLSMPGARGIQHVVEAMRLQPEMRVLVLSGSEDGALMQRLIDSGVHGYIPKSYPPEVMLSAIRLVLSGSTYIPPMALHAGGYGAAAGAADGLDHEEQLSELLTERQIDVLKLLSRGSPNKVIARELGISEGTVKIHLAAIFRALNVRNRVEAVVASQHLGET